MQKIPVGEGYTDTASIMAFGFNPFISKWSPYHGAAYAVVEAVSKAVAAGARFERMRFSYQEYFERMTDDPHTWGKPLAALLCALKMQEALGLPSIGGKDSMSGTFKDIDVPPTLIAFGITTVDAGRVISPEFKEAGHRIYLMKHLPLHNFMPDTNALKKNWEYVHREIAAGNIVSGWAVGFGGVAEAVAKMSFGNRIGAEIKINEQELFGCGYGSIVVESRGELDWPGAVELGRTVAAETVTVNGERMPIDRLLEANTVKFATVYPDRETTDRHAVYAPSRSVRVSGAREGASGCLSALVSRDELRLRYGQGVPPGGCGGHDECIPQPLRCRCDGVHRRDVRPDSRLRHLRAERRLLFG